METKDIAVNRQAFHDYSIEDALEAGIALTGTEIKSIRAGKVNLRGAYARVKDGEIWLQGMHVAEYEQGSRDNHEPTRDRKLLLHRKEIDRLQGKVQIKGLTLIPLKLYLKGDHAKVELGVARGKKLYDKREVIAERDAKRDLDRAVKEARNRG